MDRLDKYQEIVKKVKAVQSKDSKDTLLSGLHLRSNQILEEIQSILPKREFQMIFWGTGLLVTLFSILLYLRLDNYWYLAPIFGFLLFYIYHRNGWKKVLTSSNFKPLQEEEHISNFRYVEGKVNYTTNGIGIKITRLKHICLLLMLFSPMLVYYITMYWKGEQPFSNPILSIILAYLIGGFLWRYTFSGEIEKLQFQKDRLTKELDDIRYKV